MSEGRGVGASGMRGACVREGEMAMGERYMRCQTQWFGSGLHRSSDVGVWPIYYRSSAAAAAGGGAAAAPSPVTTRASSLRASGGLTVATNSSGLGRLAAQLTWTGFCCCVRCGSMCGGSITRLG